MNIVEKARIAADKLIAKAEQEFAVREQIDSMNIGLELRLVVDHADHIGLHFNITELRDILKLFDAFSGIPCIEYMGQYHSSTWQGNPKLNPDEIVSENYCQITTSGRHPDYLAAAANVHLSMWAEMPTFDKPLCINVDMGGGYPSRGLYAPRSWLPTFAARKTMHGKEYFAYSPQLFNGFTKVNYSTGAPQRGMSYQGLCFIPTRDALEMEIERVLASTSPKGVTP